MANETRLRRNFLSGKVGDSPLSSASTTLSSTALAGVPVIDTTSHLALVLDPDAVGGSPEIVWITAHAAGASSATILRGQEGTTARQHTFNTSWVHSLTAYDLTVVGTTSYKVQETLTGVTGNNVVTLGEVPVANSVLIFNAGVLRTNYSQSGKVFTFTSALTGTVTVVYETLVASPAASSISGNLGLISDDCTSLANWNTVGGTWSADGVFHQTNVVNQTNKLVYKTQIFDQPTYFQARIRFPSGNGSNNVFGGLEWGVAAGSAGAAQVRIQRVGGTWQVQWELAQQQALSTVNITALSLDTFYLFRVNRIGTSYQAFIDGVSIGTNTINANAANYPALYVSFNLTDFDDIFYQTL